MYNKHTMALVDKMNVFNGLVSAKTPGNPNPPLATGENGISRTSPAVVRLKKDNPTAQQGTIEPLETKDVLNRMADLHSVADRGKDLTIREKLEVRELEQQERSVREHERAHLRVARDLAVGGAGFQYQRGPDGQKYAVHGEVDIDASSVRGDTRASIDKALKVQHAALAPSAPSSQDLKAATQARIMEAKAYRKLSREQANEDQLKSDQYQPGEIPPPPGYNMYGTTTNHQENLFTILDLFA